ncbi:DUF1910 domain-containing protein [Bacillus sp. 3H-10]|uniref:DUF1910 domain-containing protein n=1 Tax=Bacillus aquiflavi TaxID=2672567 RepID=A0A6B3W4K3_9BACI|nr:DUF1910 domain-containing protein [Bacillus aquiflavi]NEY82866.1 DUF1910 domain-containing protein [Bacillus aquiflavi]
MRDNLKNITYFKKYLENENRKIMKYKAMADKVRIQRGEEDAGLKRAYIVIQNSYFNKLNCLYSMGAPIDEIKLLYPEIIEVMGKIWNKESGYVRLVWMLSIGVMINVSQNNIHQLQKLVQNANLNDYLVHFLFNSIDKNWRKTAKEFLFTDRIAYSMM